MGVEVGIDWHGHNDRGLGVTNTIFALECGADRAHGTMLGIGERVGNAALDQILMNLKLLGELPDRDLSKLLLLCQVDVEGHRVPDPVQLPARRRATRSAPRPAFTRPRSSRPRRKGTRGWPTASTPACPRACSGAEQEIEIGHMSGESNVIYWLRKRHIEPEATLVKQILGAAKATDHLLTEDEVQLIIKDFEPPGGPTRQSATSA